MVPITSRFREYESDFPLQRWRPEPLQALALLGLLPELNDRRSWRVQEGYYISVTPDGLREGFRVGQIRTSCKEGA